MSSSPDHEERHRSPDGALTLLVLREGDDWTIGFDGFPWHTHGDVQAWTYLRTIGVRLEPAAAARRLVEEILSGRAVIAMLSVGGVLRDVWIADDPAKEDPYQQPEETIEFRRWDGSAV